MLVALLSAGALAAPYDLDAAVARALDVGLDPALAELALAAAERTERTRRLAGTPYVSVGADLTGSVGFAGAGLATGAQLSAQMPLYAGGALRGERIIAGHLVRAAEAAQEATRQDLVWTLSSALLDLSAADAAVQAGEAALATEEELAKRIRALAAAGARTRADVLLQEAAVARQRAALVEARRLAAARDIQLEALLRIEDATFVAPGRHAGAAEGGERPTVVARRSEVDAAARAVDVARAGGRPSVDLGATARTGWESGDAATSLRDDASAAATLSVSLPLWDREATRDAVVRAELDLTEARLRLDDAARAARADLLLARNGLDAAEALLTAAEARLAAASAAAEVIADRHAAGASLTSELVAARAERAAAESDAIAARAARDKATYGLAWANGRL